jgi:hypothetical protein
MAVWPRGQVSAFAMVTNDVIVAGWGIGFTLGQFFDHPQKRIRLPDKYVSKVANRLDAPMQGRVFYVTGRGVPSGRTATIRDFGQAEVPGASMRLLQAIINYSRCSKNGYLLASRQINGAHSPSVAARNIRRRMTPRHLEQAARAVIFP